MTPTGFFFDRCCPEKLAAVIKAYEDKREVRFFDDDSRFARNTDDVDWLNTLSKDRSVKWVVISMDIKILKKPHERQAVKDSGLPFFLLGSGWMEAPMHDKCWKLLKAWPDIVRTAIEQTHRVFEVRFGSSLKIDPK